MQPEQLIPTTNQAFTYFLQNRQKVIAQKQGVSNVKEMLNKLLQNKPYALDYANHMRKTDYKQPFLKLLNLPPNISQSQYVGSLKNIYETVIAKINQQIDNPKISNQKISQMFVKLSLNQIAMQNAIKQNIQSSKIKIVQSQPEPPKKTQKVQPKKEEKLKTQPKKQQAIKPSTKKQQIKKPESQQSQMKKNNPQQNSKLKIPVFIADKNNFKGKDINVIIRYFVRSVDIDYKYKIKGQKKQSYYQLYKQLQKMITAYLKDNTVVLKRKSTQLRILQDTSYVKSADAGNYFFDPFFNAVQIKLKRKDNKQFDADFNVDAKDLNFEKVKVQKIQQWNKAFVKLTPKDNVKQLVEYIGQKRQVQKQIVDDLVFNLKKKGGAQTIQDLFNWNINQYDRLGVQATWIHEIKQTIQLIKDCSRSGVQKQYDKQKRECLKVATSHKILRYLVYKNEQTAGINNLPWLNLHNVRNAINLIKRQFHNEELLDQLNGYFEQFALDPNGKPIPFSRGLVLFGPPGTGKTVLTETMPDIMGFHLIQKGLSAADFMKSLQGQSSRMIRDLTNRANQSPYLLCSVGIDEVDGLVPDRKDKDQKNKGQGISMLLSVIGGNKDVSNLVFMTSTNYLKKIDEAIRRRLSGQFQVGRPNPQARKKILTQRTPYLLKNTQLLQKLIQITTNFTGAALNGIGNALNKNLSIKKMQDKTQVLEEDQVISVASLMARQFSITLGIYTLPQIYKMQGNKKNILTKQFLSRVHNNFAIVQDLDTGKQKIFKILYLVNVSIYVNGKLQDYYQIEEQDFDLSNAGEMEIQKGHQLQYIQKYLKEKDMFQQENVKILKSQDIRYNQAKTQIQTQGFIKIPKKNQKSKLVFVQAEQNKQKLMADLAKTIFKKRKALKADVYTIFYLPPACVRNQLCEYIFGKINEQFKTKIKYSGRIFVELNSQARMAFQLNSTREDQSKIAFKLYLKSQQTNQPKDVIPQLVKFFTKQQVSYILLLDYEMLLQNDAFQQKKMLQIMQQKMSEAKNYQRVAVMINVDSLITMSQNASDSSFGRSMSYSVVNHNMYQILLNYMRQFATVDNKYSRWISIIAKNQEIVKKVKKDLDWPIYPQQKKKEDEQKQKDQPKECVRCGQWYTQRKNKQQRTCMQHPGKIVDMFTGQFEEHSDIQQLKALTLRQKYGKKKQNEKDKDKSQDRYRYTCCTGSLSEQGHKPYYHIQSSQLEQQQDQLYHEKLRNSQKHDFMKQKMCPRRR